MLPTNSTHHAAHRPHSAPSRAGAKLDHDSPEVRERLEALDDAMFAAIAGDNAALRATGDMWRQAVDDLGWEHVEESREQYLRYAVEVTRRFEWNETRDASKAMAAIEVIELLTRG